MKASKNLIIILAAAAILLSAWVYYMSRANQAPLDEAQRTFQEVTRQSSSDDAESIESDLNDTNFDDMDKELLEIEAELNSTTGGQAQ